jgi:hypothetical protein
MKEIFELRRMNFWQTKRQTSITVWQKLKKLKKIFLKLLRSKIQSHVRK